MPKIFFSNLGYAKGIDGSLKQHLLGLHRHFYCSLPIQEQSLLLLSEIIQSKQPDLCCLVEIEQGTSQLRSLNQIHSLLNASYPHYDVADKYGVQTALGSLPFHKGRSNAFMARHNYEFERLYFKYGSKRLIYKLRIEDDTTLFFSHFSLNAKTRQKQFMDIRRQIDEISGNVIVLADFNIMKGFKELDVLLKDSDLEILNRETDHTFTFHQKNMALDLCLCSKSLMNKIQLEIIPQPFSDHDALFVSY